MSFVFLLPLEQIHGVRLGRRRLVPALPEYVRCGPLYYLLINESCANRGQGVVAAGPLIRCTCQIDLLFNLNQVPSSRPVGALAAGAQWAAPKEPKLCENQPQ